MSKYVNHLLCYGNGAETVYQQVPASKCQVAASSTASANSTNTTLLAGGFNSIHSDATYPVSPAFKLNGDLASLDDQAMAALGRAELLRANSLSFRSYTIEPDPRVTVLSANKKSLHNFTERYGNILNLSPLLLQGYDPDFSTAQELDLSFNNDRYTCTFIVKQPVNRDICTYCGSCGPACPEQCLSEQLFLDFSKCTLCNACQTACPELAIDLHAVERRKLTVPSVLLLSGTEVNFSSRINKERIFTEEQVDALFDTIYAAQVDEVVTCQPSICQYSGRLGIGCDICLAACKHRAISRGQNGIALDHKKCTECGACLASCPTGALQYARFPDAAFVEYFRNISLQVGTTIVLGCEKDLHKFWWQNTPKKFKNTLFLEYPQTSALSSMHLLFLFAQGAARICLLSPDEDSSSPLHLQVTLTETVLNALFEENNRILFRRPGNLAEILDKPEKESPVLPLYPDYSFTNRREKAAHILAFLCRQSEKQQVRLTGAPTAQFGDIVLDTEKCTLCNACVGECRIAALTADSEKFSIHHKPILCVQCGSCVELCPEEALTMQPGLSLSPLFFEKNEKAQAEPVHCKKCGKIFGTRQSLEKVMSVLTQKNLWDSQNDLLDYCDTCRVVKLFEAHKL